MLTDRFDDALTLAARLHRNQKRKVSNIPYISHLLAVAALVLEHGGDEDQAIAALLHDAVEDQGGLDTARMIRTRFGDRVADCVLACSDSTDLDKAPWTQRKESYLAALATKSADALLVTSCDKLHNARSILADMDEVGAGVFERFTAKRDGTLWCYRALADELSRLRPGPLSARLDATVREIESRA